MLIRNVIWNIVGQVVPLIAALFCIPVLLEALGLERFAILTLAWSIVGYLSFFDFGLGRALTKVVAERSGDSDPAELKAILSSGLLATLALGIFGGFLLLVFEPQMGSWLSVPSALQREFTLSVYLLAPSIPLVTTISALRGILEGYHLFRLANGLRMPLGVLTFVAPVLVLPFSKNLPVLVAALAGVRFLSFLTHIFYVRRHVSSMRGLVRPTLNASHALLRVGGWITVSNVIGPLMVYFDRFVISAVLGLAAVAYYATPYEVITKLWIIPAALAGVLFPAFAARDLAAGAALLRGGIKYLIIILWPVVLVTIVFAKPALTAWLGVDFASIGAPVLKWLAVGVLINCLAFVPFSYLQARNRADWTAKLHIVELPIYFLMLWALMLLYGVEGAAIAWVARVLADALALFMMARSLAGDAIRLNGVAGATVAALAVLGVMASLPESNPVTFLVGTLLLGSFVIFSIRSITARELVALTAALGRSVRA